MNAWSREGVGKIQNERYGTRSAWEMMVGGGACQRGTGINLRELPMANTETMWPTE